MQESHEDPEVVVGRRRRRRRHGSKFKPTSQSFAIISVGVSDLGLV